MTIFFAVIFGLIAWSVPLLYPVSLYIAYRRWRKWKGSGRKIEPRAGTLFLYTLFFFSLVAGLFLNAWDYMPFAPKAKQSEAKTNLGAVFMSQLAYFQDTKTFAGGPRAFELMNWDPYGTSRYAYFCGEDAIANNTDSAVTFSPGNGWPFRALPATGPSGFTCLAVGNIDADGYWDVWTISDAKELTNIVSDLRPPVESDYLIMPQFTWQERAKQSWNGFKEGLPPWQVIPGTFAMASLPVIIIMLIWGEICWTRDNKKYPPIPK